MNLNEITLDELGNKTLPQLKDIAKEIGIKSISKYKKSELIEMINESSNKNNVEEVETNTKEEVKEEKKVFQIIYQQSANM